MKLSERIKGYEQRYEAAIKAELPKDMQHEIFHGVVKRLSETIKDDTELGKRVRQLLELE